MARIAKNIILVGFMGSGKSTLGEKIARKQDLTFIDTDRQIEAFLGQSITTLFEKHGEAHFRALERTFLEQHLPHVHGVIAVGGGLPCYKDNMDLLLENGIVFYLQRPPKELHQRLMHAKEKRPLLADLEANELLDYVDKKLEEREPYYLRAHHVLSRDEQSADLILEKISTERKSS